MGILHLREGEAAACQLALHDMQLLHQKRPEKHDWNINKLQKLEDAVRETAETGETGDTSETWDRNQTFKKVLKTESYKNWNYISITDSVTGPNPRDANTSKKN